MFSEDVRLYMKLVTSKTYYALNDRTINLLKKGGVDMNATTSETGEGEPIGEGGPGFSDAELSKTINQETQVEAFIIENHTRAGGSCFPYLNITIFDLHKYGIIQIVGRRNYKHNCLYLALQAGGLSYIKLQELILTLRSRHIHKCDLETVCNTLEIHIDLISLRSNGENRGEHSGKGFDEHTIWVWLKDIIS